MAGVGQLAIGEGIGDAKVFNPMPAIQQYGQVLQQRQAKHENEVKQLADSLAKGYDPSGLRNDADRSAYIKQYNDVKDFAIGAENEKDATKKAMKLAEVKQKLNDLSAFSAGSKNQGIFERQIAMQHLSNPNLLDDNSAQQLKTQLQLPWNAENVVKDASGFERRVEPDVIDKAYSAHKDLLTKNLQYDNGTQTPATVAGKKGTYVVQSRGIPMDGDNGAFETTLHWATAKPDVQKSLADRYANIQGATPQQTLGLRVRQYMTDMGDKDGIYDQTKPVFHEAYKPEAPDKFYDHYNYALAHPKVSATTQQANTPIFRQKLVGDILGGNTDALRLLKARMDANPMLRGKVDIGHQDSGQGKGNVYIDIPAQGTFSDGDFKEKVPARRVFINPKDENANVKLNEIINQVTGEKVDISALETPGGKKHIGTPITSVKPQEKPQKTVIKQSDIATKAAAAGYTVKEYTQLLKQKGITIQ